MTLTSPSATIDSKENMETQVLQILADTYPNLDCGPGTPVYEMVVRPIALLWSRQAEGIDELLGSLDLSNYLSMSDEDLERVLSRYFVHRRTGNYVTGVVRVIYGTKIDVYISAGEVCEASNDRTYEVLTDHFVSKNDLPGDDINGYYVDIAVRSLGTGNQYNATTNDAVTLTGSSASSVRRAYFLADSSDGGVAESNYVLYNRAQDELALRGLYSYRSVRAMLREKFPSIQEVTPVGLRDSEIN